MLYLPISRTLLEFQGMVDDINVNYDRSAANWYRIKIDILGIRGEKHCNQIR